MKEAYYFSHDANARHDPDILAMRSVYGSEGYGWYWMIIELLREQQSYKIQITKYVWNALAMQMQCDCNAAHKFVDDCIKEFDLLHSDGDNFWSESLLRRMDSKNEKSEKARKAAEKRWGKKSPKPNSDKGSMQMDSERNADAMQTHDQAYAEVMQLKESKEKEKKEKESKGEENDIPPIDTNPHKDRIHELLLQCKVKKINIYEIDVLASYVGIVDIEVIEAAIKKSQDKHVNYAKSTLEGFVEEGITTKEHLLPKPPDRKHGHSNSRKQSLPIISNNDDEKVSEEEYQNILNKYKTEESEVLPP